MNKTIQSPVFVLSSDESSYQSRWIWFCATGFVRLMLPSWTGPLPKRIRFYVTPNPKGKWLWNGTELFRAGSYNTQTTTGSTAEA